METRILLGPQEVARAIAQLAAAIQDDPAHLVGIETGGMHLARAIAAHLQEKGRKVQLGSIDIAFHRDDWTTRGPHPKVHGSQLDWPVDGRVIWLVDDVIYTGRTVRAALGEIFDYGRPRAVRLVVLADRGGRELPIQPDVVAHRFSVPDTVRLVLRPEGEGFVLVEERAA